MKYDVSSLKFWQKPAIQWEHMMIIVYVPRVYIVYGNNNRVMDEKFNSTEDVANVQRISIWMTQFIHTPNAYVHTNICTHTLAIP